MSRDTEIDRLAQAISNLNARAADLELRLSDAQERTSTQQQALLARDNELDQLNATVFDLKRSLAERDDSIATLGSEIVSRDTEIDRLAQAISALNEQISGLETELLQARNDSDELRQDLAQKSLEIEALSVRLGDSDGRVKELTEELSALAEVLDMERQVSDVRGQLLESLTNERNSQEIALATLGDELDSVRADLLAVAVARNELAGILDQRADEIRDLQASLSSAESRIAEQAALLISLDELEANFGLQAVELEQARAELDEERKKVSEGELALAAILAANKELQTEVQDAKSEISKLGEVRDDLDLKLAAALLKISELENLADSYREARTQLESDNTDLTDRLATVESEWATEADQLSAELDRQAAELNEQIRALQASLESAAAKDENAQVEIRSFGTKLNSALAQAAAEQLRRFEAERERNELLEKEAQQLERFQSAFLSGLRDKIEGRAGVRIEDDRFVFSSEVLFESNDAKLSEEGKAEIGNVADLLTEIAEDFPDDIDWILRVDGHTDVDPIRDGGFFKDNWELSQGRSLSVVRYLIDEFDFEPKRLAATGFGEHRPIASGDSEEAKSRNRRIELKLTGS